MSYLRFFTTSTLLMIALTVVSALQANDSNLKSWYQETKESSAGSFIVTLDSNSPVAEVNEFQEWVVTISTKNGGDFVSPARISVGGGMPMHGHGLPTQPKITEYLGDGQYKLEGLKFNMHGQWVLEFEIVTSDLTDTVTFELVLDY